MLRLVFDRDPFGWLEFNLIVVVSLINLTSKLN